MLVRGLAIKTSSEVELMETCISRPNGASSRTIKTSSEVELMETFGGQRSRLMTSTDQNFFGS